MEANLKHQRDLQMARNQVDTLVDQVTELEEDLHMARICLKDAEQVNQRRLEGEREKTEEAIAALNAAQHSLHTLSRIREEDDTVESSDEELNGSVPVPQQVSDSRRIDSSCLPRLHPQLPHRGPPAHAPLISRSIVQQRKSLPPKTLPSAAVSPFKAAVLSDSYKSEARAALQPGEGRTNRRRYLTSPAQSLDQSDDSTDWDHRDTASPIVTWAEI